MAGEEIEVEVLISEVQKRPALYDSGMKEYSSKFLKEKLWNEVYNNVIDGWKTLPEHESREKAEKIQRRWRSLRDCFMRELQNQKESAGKLGKKRKKYMYFDNLLFLTPCLQNRPASGSHNPAEIPPNGTVQEQETEDPDEPTQSITTEGNQWEETANTTNTATLKKTYKQTSKQDSFEQELLSLLKEKKQTEIDADQSFLMSLTPYFKTFTEDQKIAVKIEFLNVIRKVKYMGTQPMTPVVPISGCSGGIFGISPTLVPFHQANFQSLTPTFPFAQAPFMPSPQQTMSNCTSLTPASTSVTQSVADVRPVHVDASEQSGKKKKAS